jgi:cytochrome P450
MWPDKKYTEDVKFVHEYVANYVDKAVALKKQDSQDEKNDEKHGKYVFLEELAKTPYGPEKIRDELLNVLLAGRDTTASLLSYFFWYLARRPDVAAKLREEIKALGKKRPSFEEIKSMEYLQWCLKESKFPLHGFLQKA